MARSKYENLFFALRVLLAFLLLGGVIVGIYFLAYRGYPAVAEWKTPGSHDALVMDGEIYRFVGIRGKGGWREKDYPPDRSIGRVADDGTPVVTDPVTLPPDAEPGETVKLPAPDGTPDLSRDHAYIIYSVEKQENAVLVLESDGTYAIYWKEVAAWKETADTGVLVYEKETYLRVGPLTTHALSTKDYQKADKLGLVRNDLSDADLTEADEDTRERAEHSYLLYTVKELSHLLIVEGDDGTDYLYCREGYPNPPETSGVGG